MSMDSRPTSLTVAPDGALALLGVRDLVLLDTSDPLRPAVAGRCGDPMSSVYVTPGAKEAGMVPKRRRHACLSQDGKWGRVKVAGQTF